VANLNGQEKVPQSPINERSRDGRSERGNKREREHTPHLASNHHIKLRAFSTLCINHIHKPLKYDKSGLNNGFHSFIITSTPKCLKQCYMREFTS